MASRGCKHSPDEFCYVFGTFIKTRAKKYLLTSSLKCVKHIKHILEFNSVTKTSPGHLTSAVKTVEELLKDGREGKSVL